jgi:PKD repeat protein
MLDGSFKAISKVSDNKMVVAGIGYGCEVPNKINLRLVEDVGTVLWTKEFNFGSQYEDYAYDVAATPDGGFIISAYESEDEISSYNLLIKTNSSGDTLWTKRIYIGNYTSPVSSSIITTTDGGYCVIGSVYTLDLWEIQVVKLTASGVIEWTESFGGTSNDYGKDLLQTTDGGYMITASTNSNDGDVTGNHGGSDVWVAKLNTLGGMQWQHCYGGTGNDEARSIVSISGDRFSIGGISTSNDGDVSGHHGTTSYYDYWIFKINNAGGLLWNKSYGGTLFDFASQMIGTGSDGLIIAGSSYSNDGDVTNHHGTTDYDDFWVVSIDSMGIIMWEKSIGGTDYDHGNAIGQLNNEEWMFVGSSLSGDGDHLGECADNSCYPISGQWMMKLNQQCEQFAQASFSFTQQTDLKYKFTNSSVYATSYSWNFGDGTTSSATSPTHTFPGNGEYNVCLVAKYSNCSSDTTCSKITTCNPLNPDFAFTYSGLDVSFTDETPEAAKWLWHFGDGTVDSVKNPVHTYSGHDNYDVDLTTWDSCGAPYTTTKSVNTCNGLEAKYSYSPSGNTILFTDLSEGEPNSWNWDFGDGTFSSVKNPTHTFSANDTFLVCLTIDHSQCFSPQTDCKTIITNCAQPVLADFGYSSNDNQIAFDNGSENAVTFHWNFGDGATSTDVEPIHEYPAVPAAYDVCMLATGGCGEDTTCETVLVGKNPVIANFTYISLGLSVSFNNLSVNATTYYWDFGDGTNSTAQFPFHTYSDNGVYEVCLIAFDQFSLSDTFCQTLFLCEPFEGGWSSSATGLTVSFTDASPNSIQWFWDFGDGGSSILKNPSHTYSANGSYSVCLITSNECGYTDTVCKNITVCAPLVADFSYLDTYLSVAFTDLTVNATGWLWSFGDGGTSTAANPVHNYSGAGTYQVCLSAIDMCGKTNSACDQVTVCVPLMADFTTSISNLEVNFSDATSGAVQWNWNFGDGATATGQSPFHAYGSNGTYEVCLVATDVCGNKDTTCENITVCEPLVSDFDYTTNFLTATFTDLTPNSSAWVWYFGDGSTSTDQFPVHTYSSPGSYQVCLVASNICNNTDIFCKSLIVCAPIVADFSVSSFYLTSAFMDQTGSAVSWQWNFDDGGTANNAESYPYLFR